MITWYFTLYCTLYVLVVIMLNSIWLSHHLSAGVSQAWERQSRFSLFTVIMQARHSSNHNSINNCHSDTVPLNQLNPFWMNPQMQMWRWLRLASLSSSRCHLGDIPVTSSLCPFVLYLCFLLCVDWSLVVVHAFLSREQIALWITHLWMMDRCYACPAC